MSIGVLVLRAPHPITLVELMFNIIKAAVANIRIYYPKGFIREFAKRLAET
jgi:hypothetical protein